MASPLRELLDRYRNAARSEREKGTYFERLTKVWLETAPAQREQFSKVLTWAEFAREHRIDGRDTGIDLVAQLADSRTGGVSRPTPRSHVAAPPLV